MALFDDVNRKLEALGNSVTAIGIAADAKGADIDVETTPLDEWADAIRAIPVPTPVWEADPTTNQLTNMYFQSSLTYPTQASDGTPLSTTFSPSASPLQVVGPRYFEKVIVPEYFTQVSVDITGSYINDWLDYNVRSLEIHSTGDVTWEYIWYWENLQKVYCATKTAFKLSVRTRNKRLPELNGATFIDIPNAPTIASETWGVNWADSVASVDTVVVNAPKVTKIESSDTYEPYFGNYWCGDNTFPELTTINSLLNPKFAGFTNTIRAPKLTTLGNNFIWSGTTHPGKVVLYVGPNLTSIHQNPLNRIPAQITAGLLEFHIPAGESATKTYLDSKGITYIQDYEIDS